MVKNSLALFGTLRCLRTSSGVIRGSTSSANSDFRPNAASKTPALRIVTSTQRGPRHHQSLMGFREGILASKLSLQNLLGKGLVLALFAPLFIIDASLHCNSQTFTTLDQCTAAYGGLSFGNLITDGKYLFGTASAGGASNNGTVFEITAVGSQIALYSFTGGIDGAQAASGLARDRAENLYGTTVSAGDSNCVGPFGSVLVRRGDRTVARS